MKRYAPVRCFAGIPSIDSRAMEKAEMKRILPFFSLLVAFGAQALPITEPPSTPTELAHQYDVTLGSGAYAVSYTEDYYQNGPLRQLASQLVTVPSQLEAFFNLLASGEIAKSGATFQGGSLEGDPLVQIAPGSDGTIYTTVSGMTYKASANKKLEVLGITIMNCTARLQLDNVSLAARYGATAERPADDYLELHGDPSLDTDCNSFLSWLLPGIGTYLTGSVENWANGMLQDKINTVLGKIKLNFKIGEGDNLLSGLDALVPRDKTILLPNGSVLPIGQYVHDNVTYIAAHSRLTMQFSRGVRSIPQRYGYTGTTDDLANVLYLALDSPVVSFDLMVTEKVTTSWEVTCGSPPFYGYYDGICP